MNLQGANVLVVGGFGGLGKAIVNELAGHGATVYATSRNPDTPNSIKLDLTNQQDIENLVKAFENIKLNGLILAAGEVAFGPAATTPTEVLTRLMQVNATGQIQLITALLNNLRSDQESFIVTISGKVAEIPTTGLAAYSASKAALYAYTQATSRELRKDNITLLDARPGHTETGLATRAIHGTAPNFGSGLTPQHVAKRIIEAVVNGERDLPNSAF